MRWAIVIISLLWSLPAAARPGFYATLGLGGTEVAGEAVEISRITEMSFVNAPASLSTDHGDGPSGHFRLGFNILGYGALEIGVGANGQNIDDSDRTNGGLHAQWGARLYPLWPLQGYLPELLQPFEPSFFFGGGLTYQIYKPTVAGGTAIDVAWRNLGTFCFGVGLEYFLHDLFKIGIDYSLIAAPIDVFIFNFDDDIRSDVDPPAGTLFHSLSITIAFHWDPFEQPTRLLGPKEAEAADGDSDTSSAIDASPAVEAEPEPEPEPPPESTPQSDGPTAAEPPAEPVPESDETPAPPAEPAPSADDYIDI